MEEETWEEEEKGGQKEKKMRSHEQPI